MDFLLFSRKLLLTALGHIHGAVFGSKDLDHSLNKINIVRYSFYSVNQTNTTKNILRSWVSTLALTTALLSGSRKDSREVSLHFNLGFADYQSISSGKEVLAIKAHT